MSARSKEDDLLLDQKIAQIRKKNEEILKRAKEVEEDKKFAMEQNALVQLRPAIVDDSRERTPALRPSSREFNKGNNEAGDFVDVSARHAEVPSFRGRGARGGYNRDRNDRRDGPPPDPRSFLADSERDPPAPRDGRAKPYTRGEEAKPYTRCEEMPRGNREFQRGGRRESRGWGGGRGDRIHHRESREDAWRAERLRIDEARIQRQKTADGKWRREWDSDKIREELNDDAKVGRGRGDARPMEQWKHSTHANSSPHGNCDYSHGRGGSFRGGRGGRGGNSYHPDRGNITDGSFGHDMLRSHNNIPSGGEFDNFRGRGVGRSTPLNKSSTPALRRVVPNSPTSSRNDKSPQHASDTEIVVDSSKGTQHRSVKNVGDSLEVSISNVQDERHGDRPMRDRRHGGRFSKQTKNSHSSYSSQSEDDLPKDKGLGKTKRDRGHFQNKQSHIISSHVTDEKTERIASENLGENVHRVETVDSVQSEEVEEKVQCGEVESVQSREVDNNVQNREVEDNGQSGEVEGNVQSSQKDMEEPKQLTNIEDLGIAIPKNQNPLPPFKGTPEVLKKTEEADCGDTSIITGGNSETTDGIKLSRTDSCVQVLESNSEQDSAKSGMISAEKKLSSVENHTVEITKVLEGSNVKVTNAVNDSTTKETSDCIQESPLSVESSNKNINVGEQTSATNEKSEGSIGTNSEQMSTVVATTEVNTEDQKVDVTKPQENEIKTECTSAEKQGTTGIEANVSSETKTSCDSVDTEKTSGPNQANTENKEAVSENTQGTGIVIETATQKEDTKSAE